MLGGFNGGPGEGGDGGIIGPKSQPRTGHTREPDPKHNALKHTTTRKIGNYRSLRVIHSLVPVAVNRAPFNTRGMLP